MSFVFPEPSRHDLNFTLRDIPVRVTPWFWLAQGVLGGIITAPFLLMGAEWNGLVGAIPWLLVFPAWIMCAFVSILVHELGHVVVGGWFGSRGEIILTVLGGLAAGSAELSRRSHRILVYLAGPTAQLLLAGAVWTISWWFEPGIDFGGGPRTVVALALAFLLWINVAWPLFNLLPVPPLDGGQVVMEIIKWYRFGDPPPWEQDADWWKRGTSTSDWRYSADNGKGSYFRRVFPWVMTAAGVAFVIWWAYDSQRNRRRHEAFAKLERLGGRFGWDGKDTFYGVDLSGRDVGDEELALIEVFNDDLFDHVDLGRTRITDAGLGHLSGLKGLEVLDLQDTRVGDEGLSHIAGLKKLRLLELSGTRVTDAGLTHLEKMQDLEWLSLCQTGVTDAGIVHLRRLSGLKALYLYKTAVSADGQAELRRALPSLKINPTVGDATAEARTMVRATRGVTAADPPLYLPPASGGDTEGGGLDVQDVWGRSLKKAGVTLVDWEGYLANPAVRLTLRPPAAAVFPVTFRLAADGPRLYFDDHGTRSSVGPDGPRKTASAADKDSRPAVYLAIFPDRDGKDEDYTLALTCTDAKGVKYTLRLPIHVIDQDKERPEPLPFKITVDFTQDKTGFFKDARARAIVQQAADDWAYFLDGMALDPVPAGAEATLIWSRKGFVSPTTVRNATEYTGYLLYAYGIEGAELRSGGEGSRLGGFQTSNGKGLDLRRSGGLEVEVRGNYNRLGWFYTAGDDDWWKSANRGDEPNDLYSIVHHEIGHALIFNPAYPRFDCFKQAGAVDDAAVKAWVGAAPKIDRSDHLDGTVDPASRRGAFGYEYHGDMPKRRWLITKTDLLVAQAVGYRLRKTSAFEPLTAKVGPAPAGTVGKPYRATLAIRGLPPYHCSVAAGNLPPGLTLDPFTGEITGVPTAAGVFAVTVQVRDDPKSQGLNVPLRIEIGG